MSNHNISLKSPLPNTEYEYFEVDEPPKKCFLCYADFRQDETPWFLYEKWDSPIGDKRSRAEILSLIVDMEMVENIAHSKFLCGNCNKLILDYEEIRKAFYDLRDKIISDFQKTIQLVNDFDRIKIESDEIVQNCETDSRTIQDQVLEKTIIKDTEEIRLELMNTKEMNQYAEQEFDTKNRTEHDIKSTNNNSIAIFRDTIRNEYITFNTILSEDTEPTETFDEPTETVDISDCIAIDEIQLSTEILSNNDIQRSTAPSDVTNCKLPNKLTKTVEKNKDDAEKFTTSHIQRIFNIKDDKLYCLLCTDSTSFPINGEVSFSYHLKSVHGKHLCPSSLSELGTHIKERRLHRCKIRCDKCHSFLSKKKFIEHKCTVPEDNYYCDKCNVYCDSTLYRIHMRICGCKTLFFCSFCAKAFTSSIGMSAHVKIHAKLSKKPPVQQI